MNVGMGPRAARDLDGCRRFLRIRIHDGLGGRLDDGRAILSSSILLALTTGHGWIILVIHTATR